MSQVSQSDESINALNPPSAYPEYDYPDAVQGPSEGEAIEMTTIRPKGTIPLIPRPRGQTNANRRHQETNENNEDRRSQGTDRETEPGSRQDGIQKFQIHFWMIYFCLACFICLFVVFGVIFCKILL